MLKNPLAQSKVMVNSCYIKVNLKEKIPWTSLYFCHLSYLIPINKIKYYK